MDDFLLCVTVITRLGGVITARNIMTSQILVSYLNVYSLGVINSSIFSARYTRTNYFKKEIGKELISFSFLLGRVTNFTEQCFWCLTPEESACEKITVLRTGLICAWGVCHRRKIESKQLTCFRLLLLQTTLSYQRRVTRTINVRSQHTDANAAAITFCNFISVVPGNCGRLRECKFHWKLH